MIAKRGAMALLLSSVCATSAVAQDFYFGPSIASTWGGSWGESGFGQVSEAPDSRADFLEGRFVTDNGLTFDRRIELDNGLTFGGAVEIAEESTGVGGLDDVVFVTGSFGNVMLGSDPDDAPTGYFAPNFRVPAAQGYSGCGNDTGSRVSFAGVGASLGYGVDLSDRSRGALAYDAAGQFRNPAFEIDYDLSGPEYTVGAGFCIDTGRLFPSYFTVSLGGSDLSGSGDIRGQAFPNLGVTGVGGDPGVLINAPTDLLSGGLDVERDSRSISFGFDTPIRINADGVTEEFVATPSGSAWVPINAGPSIGLLSVIGNFHFGQSDQTEQLDFRANTPAFGANSAWDARYRTDFDATSYGADIGLRAVRSFGARGGGTNSLSLSGLVGYHYYDIDVSDSVTAMGLGGALNYSNRENHSYDDGVVTAELTAGYTWQRGTQSLRLTAGIEYGKQPEYDYSRPDSTDAGVALDPKLDLEPDFRVVLGAAYTLGF